MSAECSKCGTDIVYPAGTWPVGECPICTRDARIALLEAVAEAARGLMRVDTMAGRRRVINALDRLDEARKIGGGA